MYDNFEVKLAKLADDTLKAWTEMLKMALKSGALSEEMKDDNNYLLVKAIVDCWCRKRPYAPASKVTQREFANLARLI